LSEEQKINAYSVANYNRLEYFKSIRTKNWQPDNAELNAYAELPKEIRLLPD